MTEKDSTIIPFKNKSVKLIFEQFEDVCDVDQLTQIDYNNLYAEIITIPALMNRVGMWKAEAENNYSVNKLDREIYKAQRAEHYRKELARTTYNSKNNKIVKYPTKDQVDNGVVMDQGVQLREKKVLRLKKEAEYIDALYWAIKSKEMKLNRISENMGFAPEDFEKELVEGKFNSITIKVKQNLIQDHN